MSRLLSVVVAVGLVVASAASARAQVLGTFPWQMQPYCNVVTLTLTSAPAGFTLDGTDDQCGATDKASAVGVASFNGNGNVTLNFTIVTAPAGRPVHVSAVVNPANGGGTWSDSAGNAGTFAFFGASTGLPVRPLPTSGVGAGTITSVELAPAAVGAAQLAANAVTGAAVADGSLAMADVANGPRVVFVDGNQSVGLGTADTQVRTLTIDAPSAGRVVVHASGSFLFSDTTTTSETARCVITTGDIISFSNLVIATDGGATVNLYVPWAGTRAFDVAAGPFTVNLVCDRFGGTVNVAVEDTSLVAQFVAQ